MQTTNKFSNFGFFAGSPRATARVQVDGNIDNCKDDDIEVSIEENIEEHTGTKKDNAEEDLIDKERIKNLVMTR